MILNTFTSEFTWKLENVGTLRKLGGFVPPQGIRINGVKIEGTRFMWHAQLYEDYEEAAAGMKKQTELTHFIYPKDTEGFYDKFSFTCSIEITSEKGFAVIPPEGRAKPLCSYVQTSDFVLPRSYETLQLKFIVTVYEHDLSHCNMRAINGDDFKRNLAVDLRNLLAYESWGEQTLQVETEVVSVHKSPSSAIRELLSRKQKASSNCNEEEEEKMNRLSILSLSE